VHIRSRLGFILILTLVQSYAPAQIFPFRAGEPVGLFGVGATATFTLPVIPGERFSSAWLLSAPRAHRKWRRYSLRRPSPVLENRCCPCFSGR
jgi:hypothetical protein